MCFISLWSHLLLFVSIQEVHDNGASFHAMKNVVFANRLSTDMKVCKCDQGGAWEKVCIVGQLLAAAKHM